MQCSHLFLTELCTFIPLVCCTTAFTMPEALFPTCASIDSLFCAGCFVRTAVDRARVAVAVAAVLAARGIVARAVLRVRALREAAREEAIV